MNDPKKEYLNVLSSLSSLIKELSETERGFLSSASSKDTASLRTLVKDSEPCLMRLKSLERKRAALEHELSLTGKSLSEMEEFFDKKEFLPIKDSLTLSLKEFKDIEEAAARLLRVREAEYSFSQNSSAKGPVSGAAHMPQSSGSTFELKA